MILQGRVWKYARQVRARNTAHGERGRRGRMRPSEWSNCESLGEHQRSLPSARTGGN